MHLTLVGPTHPYKGGVAQHTTTLAHKLAAAGHEVDLVSWSAQYPSALFPGVQRVSTPEIPVYPRTSYPLAWYRPDSWWRLGRALRGRDGETLLLVLVTPIQIPAYLAIIGALRRQKGQPGPPTVGVICHNVLPHEPRPGDRALTRALLRRADFAVTHSREEEGLARTLGARDVRYAEVPPHGPGAAAGTAKNVGGAGLLFFGFIRPYKGVDVLLRAIATVPDVRLVVAGESWEGAERLRSAVDELGVADRVELRLRYLDNEELEPLLRHADV
jgi:glycosyltransferase involved in cell wall biosynthesis